MSVIRVSGTPNVQNFVKTASTAYTANQFVKLTSGQLIASIDGDISILGIGLETVASTDADYATARPTPVDMIDDRSVLQITTIGTLTAAMVGLYFDIDDAGTADAATSSALSSGASGAAGPLICVGFISATLGLYMVASSALNAQVMPTS